jgi:hypothetical protein
MCIENAREKLMVQILHRRARTYRSDVGSIVGSTYMDERAFQSLTQFCADQFSVFDACAWGEKCAIDRRAITVTAKYLSMTSWYGHEEELERISVGVDAPILNVSQLHRETQAIGLDLKTLSARLRHKIALRQR